MSHRRTALFLSLFAAVSAPCIAADPAAPAVASSGDSSISAAADHAVVQALLRLPDAKASDFPGQEAAIARHLKRLSASAPGDFVRIAKQLGQVDDPAALLAVIQSPGGGQAAIDAVPMLIESGHADMLAEALENEDDTVVIQTLSPMGFSGGDAVADMVLPIMLDESRRSTVRSAAAVALGRNWHGQQRLLVLARENNIPESLKFEISNALLGSWTKEIAKEAASLSSLETPAAKSGETFPPVAQLARMNGDPDKGKVVFNNNGTCSKCHVVGEEGKEVGPNLSEIGSKLSREDMYVSILNPSAGISHNYETYAVLTADGQLVTGLLVNQSDEAVTIKTADAVLVTVADEDIEDLKKQEVSLMPADLQKNMTVDDMVNLIEYMRLLTKPDDRRFDAVTDNREAPSREADDAIAGFDIADGLTVQLFASEPLMLNPTSIDVDHLGRIWVCEAVNYRHFRNPDATPRVEGDRILVMEDTDGDGTLDKQTVFYQGTDIDSPHGVCVMGNRVIVSAGENVFSFIDTDGDLVADEKNVLFTGLSGVQHDHGIHSFMPGPDGKLYFNFGNEGKQLKRADGSPVVDLAGNEVNDTRNPYQQGMVFRCDLDGSNVETLGWNFRNNWEVCVDSFGTMWQSDNDDDGNRGTRINYVMEYGNYGYRDEKTGEQWYLDRIGSESETGQRHWHLNDPGVIPNLVQTGAGSPTGIMFYEGDLLPAMFQNEVIHTDPGPNVVRSYPVKNDGAGYSATIENMVKGVRDQWFRPVDVCAAPDGSVIVADWYDPGVGGHRMGDIERGRLFRITVAGHESYRVEAPDFSTMDGAKKALASPNVSTRFLAGQALLKFWAETTPEVSDYLDAAKVASPQLRARYLWLLSKTPAVAGQAIKAGLKDADANLRITAIRAARQIDSVTTVRVVKQMVNDPSPQVRRELAIALRGDASPIAVELWTQLAMQHDGKDRWYLEALGIGASDKWDACLASWLEKVGEDWNSPAGRDIVWRSRSSATPALLAKLILAAETPAEQQRYFRALDFFDDGAKRPALEMIVAK